MTKTISGTEAALSEAAGNGELSLVGRTIKFRRDGFEFSWSCRTERDAAQQLRIFRAAPKYMVAA